MKKIQLAKGLYFGGLGIEKAIASRRSERSFSGKTMSLAELSHILYYTGGITDKHNGFRAAPSAGATYPIEVYPVVNNVDDLTTGVHHYLVTTHELELIRAGDFRQEMAKAALGQGFLAKANVVLMLSAVFQRTQQQYGERGQRYIFFEAGHIAQNACLIATSMRLGSCAVGAFHDGDFNRMLGLNSRNESVLYLVAVGKI